MSRCYTDAARRQARREQTARENFFPRDGADFSATLAFLLDSIGTLELHAASLRVTRSRLSFDPSKPRSCSRMVLRVRPPIHSCARRLRVTTATRDLVLGATGGWGVAPQDVENARRGGGGSRAAVGGASHEARRRGRSRVSTSTPRREFDRAARYLSAFSTASATSPANAVRRSGSSAPDAAAWPPPPSDCASLDRSTSQSGERRKLTDRLFAS